MPELIDLKGQTFGRLLVIKRSKPRYKSCNDACWKCKCECGNTIVAIGQQLRSGRTKSCGCLRSERMMKGLNYQHGQSETPRWRMWVSARSRAKAKGIPFSIKLTDVPAIPIICPVLGIPLTHNLGHKGHVPGSPSLDRKIPTKGYIPGNIQIISQRANQIKSDATVEEVGLVYSYMIKVGHADLSNH